MASGPISFSLARTFLELVEDRIAQFLAVQRLRLDAFGKNVHAEAGEDRIFQALHVPFVGMGLDRGNTGPSDR